MIKMQHLDLKLAIFIAFHGKLLNNLFFLCTQVHARFSAGSLWNGDILNMKKKSNCQLNCDNTLLYCLCKKLEMSFLMQDNQMILYHWYSSFWKWTTGINHWPKVGKFSLMSRIDCKYCSICTSYLAGLFDIFILLHIWQNYVCFGDFLPMRTLCDAFESH